MYDVGDTMLCERSLQLVVLSKVVLPPAVLRLVVLVSFVFLPVVFRLVGPREHTVPLVMLQPFGL